MERNCENCVHEIICRLWKKELDSAEESYTGENYVTIYDRYNVNGDGCEHFRAD